MGWFEQNVQPRLLTWSANGKAGRAWREEMSPLIAQAQGVVLEIGMGAGHNLRFYDASRVERFYGLEPSQTMRALAAERIAAAPFHVELIDLPGERIPLEADSVDTVLTTLTLCAMTDPVEALQGMARVLRPGGKLLFAEHGLAPDPKVRRWQKRLNGLNQRLAGCQLTRPIPELIDRAGFDVDSLESRYAEGMPRFTGYCYYGVATTRSG